MDIYKQDDDEKNTVEERTLINNYPDAGQDAIFEEGNVLKFTLKTSDNWIKTYNSYLVGSIQVFCDTAIPTAPQNTFLYGSILNIFRHSITSDKYENVIDRIHELNQLNYNIISLIDKETQDNSLNAMIMSRSDFRGGLTNSPFSFTILNGEFESITLDFAIPLKYISSVFNTKQMMPPSISNGLRIELALNKYVNAFVQHLTGGQIPFTGYRIKKCHLRLDAYRFSLNEHTKLLLNNLNYKFNAWQTELRIFEEQPNITSFSISINRSASIATKALMIRRNTNLNGNYGANHFASVPMSDSEKSYWRVGNIAYPRDKLNGVLQHYMNLYYTNNGKIAFDLTQFKGSSTINASSDKSNYGHATYNADFKRNNKNYGGVELNSDNPLLFDIDTVILSPEVWLFFVQHLKEVVIGGNKNTLLT